MVYSIKSKAKYGDSSIFLWTINNLSDVDGPCPAAGDCVIDPFLATKNIFMIEFSLDKFNWKNSNEHLIQ